jgi:ribokinase
VSRVVVVGSLNCDLVLCAARRPDKGETVFAQSFQTFVGGKGNNQALACARAGASVAMIGRIGADGFGDTILDKLRESGVAHDHVSRDPELSTGVAQILVDADGDNSIVVAPQANLRLTPREVEAAAPLLESARVVLLQLEVPYASVLRAAAIAKAAGATVVLNPAPAPPDGHLPVELWNHVDVIVPNQPEAETLTHHGARDVDDAAAAARRLLDLGAGAAIVTMGELGALLVQPGADPAFTRAFPVAAEDTTAAGDAFCGALAAALAEDRSLEEAVRWACAAGALACTKLGAEPSLPLRADIERLVGGEG